jgi:hypothetical protein
MRHSVVLGLNTERTEFGKGAKEEVVEVTQCSRVGRTSRTQPGGPANDDHVLQLLKSGILGGGHRGTIGQWVSFADCRSGTYLKNGVDHEYQRGASSRPERADPLLSGDLMRGFEYGELPQSLGRCLGYRRDAALRVRLGRLTSLYNPQRVGGHCSNGSYDNYYFVSTSYVR